MRSGMTSICTSQTTRQCQWGKVIAPTTLTAGPYCVSVGHSPVMGGTEADDQSLPHAKLLTPPGRVELWVKRDAAQEVGETVGALPELTAQKRGSDGAARVATAPAVDGAARRAAATGELRPTQVGKDLRRAAVSVAARAAQW